MAWWMIIDFIKLVIFYSKV